MYCELSPPRRSCVAEDLASAFQRIRLMPQSIAFPRESGVPRQRKNFLPLPPANFLALDSSFSTTKGLTWNILTLGKNASLP